MSCCKCKPEAMQTRPQKNKKADSQEPAFLQRIALSEISGFGCPEIAMPNRVKGPFQQLASATVGSAGGLSVVVTVAAGLTWSFAVIHIVCVVSCCDFVFRQSGGISAALRSSFVSSSFVGWFTAIRQQSSSACESGARDQSLLQEILA